MQSLLASCLGLVIVDREEPTVRLVHFTLHEHLNSHPKMFQNPYAVMADVCLTYLNFDSIRKLPRTLDAAPQENPFLQLLGTLREKRNHRGGEITCITTPGRIQ